MIKLEHHGGSHKLATFFLTNKCNLTCQYCYAIENTFPENSRFETKELDLLLDYLAENNYSISLGGGEPLLEKALMLEIARKASNRNMGVALLSNGLLLNEQIIDELISSGIDWVQISADSIEDVKRYSHLIRMGADAGLRMAIGTVLLPSRINDIKKMHDIISDSRAAGWRLLRYTPLNHNPLVKDDLSNQTWIQTLIALEDMIRPLNSPINIRYEPSILPYSWLKNQPVNKRLDVCGGRNMRRLFLYPNGDVYACGLPRRKGIEIGNFKIDAETFYHKLQKMKIDNTEKSPVTMTWENSFNRSILGKNVGTIEKNYCTEQCRGGCMQVKGEKLCDPRCDSEHGLVPVCCFEKLLLSPGNRPGETTYPSEVYN